jgi:hypothetical protein
VSRFWLAYKQSGRLLGVVILDSSSLSSARMLASVERIDQGAAFGKGYRLDKGAADFVPVTAIGRMLSPDEAGEIRRIERGIPKRAAAASVRRAVTRKRAMSR